LVCRRRSVVALQIEAAVRAGGWHQHAGLKCGLLARLMFHPHLGHGAEDLQAAPKVMAAVSTRIARELARACWTAVPRKRPRAENNRELDAKRMILVK